MQFLQQINVKNVHQVYGGGIQTHDLQNMNLLPLSLDQGSRPKKECVLDETFITVDHSAKMA